MHCISVFVLYIVYNVCYVEMDIAMITAAAAVAVVVLLYSTVINKESQ